eukprot:gene7027-12652_t
MEGCKLLIISLALFINFSEQRRIDLRENELEFDEILSSKYRAQFGNDAMVPEQEDASVSFQNSNMSPGESIDDIPKVRNSFDKNTSVWDTKNRFKATKFIKPFSQRSDEPPRLNERSDEPPRLKERSDEPPRLNERSDEPPRLEERSDEPPRLKERSDEPPRLKERSDEPPRFKERSDEPPRLNEGSDEPPRLKERSDEPPRLKERSDEPPRSKERSDEPPRLNERSDEPPRLEERSDEPPRLNERSDEPSRSKESSDEPPRLKERSDEPPRLNERSDEPSRSKESSDEPPRLKERSDEPPRLNERSDEPPRLKERSDEPPRLKERSDEPPRLKERSDEPPRLKEHSDEPPRLKERSDEPQESFLEIKGNRKSRVIAKRSVARDLIRKTIRNPRNTKEENEDQYKTLDNLDDAMIAELNPSEAVHAKEEDGQCVQPKLKFCADSVNYPISKVQMSLSSFYEALIESDLDVMTIKSEGAVGTCREDLRKLLCRDRFPKCKGAQVHWNGLRDECVKAIDKCQQKVRYQLRKIDFCLKMNDGTVPLDSCATPIQNMENKQCKMGPMDKVSPWDRHSSIEIDNLLEMQKVLFNPSDSCMKSLSTYLCYPTTTCIGRMKPSDLVNRHQSQCKSALESW